MVKVFILFALIGGVIYLTAMAFRSLFSGDRIKLQGDWFVIFQGTNLVAYDGEILKFGNGSYVDFKTYEVFLKVGTYLYIENNGYVLFNEKAYYDKKFKLEITSDMDIITG